VLIPAPLICGNTRTLTSGHFNYRDLGPVTLKAGHKHPIWQVLGATDVESRFEARHKSNPPWLIGGMKSFSYSSPVAAGASGEAALSWSPRSGHR
jgi:hypothetical protein